MSNDVDVQRVVFLNNPDVAVNHKWKKSWKTLWLVEVVVPSYVLVEDINCIINFSGGSSCYLTVKAGFECDLASIPFFLRGVWLPDAIERESILHDILYRTRTYNRRLCDRILRQAMRDTGKPSTVSSLFYSTLRCFGWSAWNSMTERSTLAAQKFINMENVKNAH